MSRFAYSQDGQPTLIPKNSKDIKLGQALTLSPIDRMKINKLYQCGWYQISEKCLQFFLSSYYWKNKSGHVK